ncbi:hypothetical protein MKJ04_14455 [Pontibacter sp. E15-1]|uniref:hypothetical protein n=1 Tax=Pontibacter sp. E15-1 TaxID=2919918 RepID=UPI001F500FB2|nr:hypothetical protein [Pontibacter sp. E15-1]MCJ8166045.1 hypothetical protein [Pontibacter sp. E15-1]
MISNPKLASILLEWPYTDQLMTSGIANLEEAVGNLLKRTHTHQKFTFGVENSVIGTSDENPCGENGCMIGDMPLLRPDAWEFKKIYGRYMPVLRPLLAAKAQEWAKGMDTSSPVGVGSQLGEEINSMISAMWWFKITNEMYNHHFLPLDDYLDIEPYWASHAIEALKDINVYGGDYFYEDANEMQIAYNINSFIRKLKATWPDIKEEWHKLHGERKTCS